MKEPVIGIDLGTRYALAAHCPPGGTPTVLPNRWGQFRTPSFVAMQDGQFVAGDDAAKIALMDPSRAWWDVKRKLGTDWLAHYEGSTYTAEELLVPLLALIREDAEASLGSFIDTCALAVPAHFGFPERGAISIAAKNAGFTDVRIVNEPTAAALSVGQEGSFLVLDYGAGTTDVSVVEAEGGVFQVVDSMGRSDMGGYDLDRTLAQWLWQALEGCNMSTLDPRWPLLMQEAEQIKITLSDSLYTSWHVPMGLSQSPVAIDVKRQDLELLIHPMIAEICRMVERLYKRHSPQRLLLVGGSSRLPLLRQRLSQKVAEPDKLRTCPDEAVALGAALFCRQGRERLLLDVLSQSIGVADSEGLVVPLLRRGTPLPAEARRSFTCPGGPWSLTVVHGEGALRDESRILQKIELGYMRAKTKVDVRFKVDSSGLLAVDVTRDGEVSRRVVTLEEDGEEDVSIDIDDELEKRQNKLLELSAFMTTGHQQRLYAVHSGMKQLKGSGNGVIREVLSVLDGMIADIERITAL